MALHVFYTNRCGKFEEWLFSWASKKKISARVAEPLRNPAKEAEVSGRGIKLP